MKNKVILACFTLSLVVFTNAQVGINTPNPTSTLDVVAKTATEALQLQKVFLFLELTD